MTMTSASRAPSFQNISSVELVSAHIAKPLNKARGLTVTLRPALEPVLVLLGHLLSRFRNTLEDIVDLSLGDVEDGRMALGRVPPDVEADKSPEADEGVAHQSDTAALRRGGEEGYRDRAFFQVRRKRHEPLPELHCQRSCSGYCVSYLTDLGTRSVAVLR